MRRGPSPKRKTVPDPVFDSNLVSQLTNQILQDGKKDKARTIVYGAMSIIEKKGAAVKKREDVHKMAESNKAFAHFRW